MADALAPPFLLAAAVLCLAGAAKLQSPSAAAAALRTLRLPAGRAAVRAFAVGELGLGAWCAVAPGRVNAMLMAGVYCAFAGLSILLARRRQSCGCFGASDAPASPVQAALSASLSAISVAAAITTPPVRLGWLAGRPPGTVVVLTAGVLAGVYAAILVYTELPHVWSAWSDR